MGKREFTYKQKLKKIDREKIKDLDRLASKVGIIIGVLILLSGGVIYKILELIIN